MADGGGEINRQGDAEGAAVGPAFEAIASDVENGGEPDSGNQEDETPADKADELQSHDAPVEGKPPGKSNPERDQIQAATKCEVRIAGEDSRERSSSTRASCP